MNYIKIYKFFFILSVFLVAHATFAAELRLSADAVKASVGDTIKIRMVVNSGQSINAVSGQISFPKNILQVQSLSKTGSIINQWAVDPSFSNTNGTVSLEGVVLNGYKGSGGTILTIVFKAKASGTATIQILSGAVLANDGEGTDVLTNRTGVTISIGAVTEKEKVIPIKETLTTKLLTPEIQIEEIKKKDEMDPKSRFLITSILRNTKVPYRIEVDTIPHTWEDPGNHIFETTALTRGSHTLKVIMESTTGEIVSNSITFATSGIMTPVITDYAQDISENDFIVVKGMADPLAYIMITSDGIISDMSLPLHEAVTVRADEKGVFTYVSERRASKGVYMISARARTESGVESGSTVPLRVSVSGNFSFFKKVSDMLSLAVPFFSLLLLLSVLIIYGVYRVVHYHKRLGSRITEAEALIAKSFGILEEDLNEEIKIFKKVKALEPLTDDEKVFIKQFKKDLRSAEKVIVTEVKNTKKKKS